MRRPALLVGVIGLRCLPPRYRTGHLVLLLLQFGWDNPWAASTEFLKAMIVSVKSTSGTILECGSGLTTLILCRLVDAKERKVIALEHDADWYSHITNRLTRFSTGGVNVCMVPMREYGTFHWYDISGIHIPENIDLVICDGPPGSTLGGRYGLLPILQSNLRPKCTILLDDAERGSERNVLREWDQKYKISVEIQAGKKAFAILTLDGKEESADL